VRANARPGRFVLAKVDEVEAAVGNVVVTIEIEGQPKPALVAESVVRLLQH
jgi:hypothetical protein